MLRAPTIRSKVSFWLVLAALVATLTPVWAQGDPCQALCIDDYVGSNRSFWNASSSGLGNFTFVGSRGGEFVIDHATGTARIMGELISVSDANRRFSVDITLSGVSRPGDANYPPQGSPKIEGPTAIYDVNGGPIDTTIWTYWTNLTGTLTGLGDYAGAIVEVDRRGPAAQFGFGGNVKDDGLGISSWTEFTTLQQPSTGETLPGSWNGDINASIGRQCVPEPFPGTTDDLQLRMNLDGDAPRRGLGASVNEGRPGQMLTITVDSPNGTFAGDSLIVGINCFMTCAPLPEFYAAPWDMIYMTPGDGQSLEVFGPNGLLGPANLDDEGRFSFTVPVYGIFQDMSLIMQAFVISSEANDGFLAVTNALRFDILPPLSGPDAPQNIQAASVDSDTANVSWDAVTLMPEGIRGYRVYVDGEFRTEVDGATSVDVEGLTELTDHAIEVIAVSNLDYESPRSVTTNVTMPADLSAPQIMSASALSTDTVEVVFDERIEATCATDLANYAIDGGINVTGAVLDLDGRRVTLQTTALLPDVAYMLTVNGIFDLAQAQNQIPADTEIAIDDARVSDGLIALYTFDEGQGTTVQDTSGVQPALDLTIADPSKVTWSAGSLSVDAATTIATVGAASRIETACQATQEISIEAWVKPANLTQSGPARIATFSNGTGNRNFTLGQNGDDYITRLRTTDTNNNGLPNLESDASVTTNLQHVVFTRDAAGAWVMWVDGVQTATGTRSGTFANWNADWTFRLANESSMNRAWLGELHLVAIYDRALDATEVQRNLNAGH